MISFLRQQALEGKKPALQAFENAILDTNRAFCHLDLKHVEKRLKKLDSKNAGPLFGVPVAIKDNICQLGQPCEACSPILKGYIAPYNACVVEKLENSGAVIIGRTNMDELAMGSSTEHSMHGPSFNPKSRDLSPGGSSGGSAVSVASGIVPVALGSDTGGSVRQPASFCGVFGFLPTYGRVSRRGLVAFASSMDQIGTFATDIEDLALVSKIISGHDLMDSTSSNLPIWKEEKPSRIAILDIDQYLDPIIMEAFSNTIRQVRDLGFVVEKIKVSSWDLALPCYHVISSAEASTNFARLDGLRFGARGKGQTYRELVADSRAALGIEVRRRLLMGAHVLSNGIWEKAHVLREQIKTETLKMFENYDLIITPTTSTTAFKLGSRIDSPVNMYEADKFTVPANLCGLPALSMPNGIQVIGPPFREGLLFDIVKRLF